MPAYNAAEFIGEAMASVLSQSFTDWELVVVNDGSQDKTGEAARRPEDRRIRVIDLEHNSGLATVRNRCVSEARGRYIAFLDADDRMTAGRLERQVEFLDGHPEIALVGGQIEIFPAGEASHQAYYLPSSPSEIQAAMLFCNPLATSTVTARTSILQSFAFRGEFPPLEDYDLWQRVSQEHPCYNLEETLAEYRVHDTQSTHRNSRELRQELRNRIRSERLHHLWSGATQADADLHQHLCEGTYWSDFDELKPVIAYCKNVLSAIRKNHRPLFAHVRDLMREKLTDLIYRPDAKMTPQQFGFLSKSMLHPLFRRSYRETFNDIRLYLLSLRTRMREDRG